jgi:hypothetical protein
VGRLKAESIIYWGSAVGSGLYSRQPDAAITGAGYSGTCTLRNLQDEVEPSFKTLKSGKSAEHGPITHRPHDWPIGVVSGMCASI